MPSPSSVLTLGYGAWGSVNDLPTLGFGFGSVVSPPPAGGLVCYTLSCAPAVAFAITCAPPVAFTVAVEEC